MEFGLVNGLAANSQYDQKINDLRYRDLADKRAAAEAEQRAKLYAEENSAPALMNEYDAPRLKSYVYDKMKELGRYYKNNPDARYDPMKQVEIKRMRNEIKDNPIVRRGMAVDSAYKEYIKDRQESLKNPEQWDTQALDEQGRQFQNYFKYGHGQGLGGLDKEGEQPVIYTRPPMFVDENDLYDKAGQRTQARGFEYLKNGRDGGFKTYALDKDLDEVAHGIYAAHQRQFDVRYKNQGLDPIKEIKEKIRPRVKTDFDIGDKNRLGEEMALAKYKSDLDRSGQQPGASAYDISILNTGYTQAAGEDLDATYGSKIPHVITNGVTTIDNSGDTFHYAGDIYDDGYRKDGKYQKNGVKVVDGYVYKPLDWAKEHDIIDNSYMPWSNDKVNGEWKDKASIVNTPVDKDGKSEKVVKIKVNAKVNANTPMYRGKFDKHILTTKQREGAGVQESTMQQSYEGHPVGSIVQTTKGNYLVTPNGYIKQ